MRKSRVNFFTNIVLPSMLAVLLFVFTLFYIVVPRFENAMLDRKREMITELTNAATSVLAKYHKDEVEGHLTRQQAQQTAVSRIQYLRYGEDDKDYFWITDMQPVMIMHPYRPELNKQSLDDYEDREGKKLFVEIVKLVQEQQHGFIEYMWQWKDDPTLIVPKLSYVNSFEPWGWIIGTGIYIEDVKAEIAGLTKALTRISLTISLIIIFMLFYVGRQSFKIETKRRKAEDELNQTKEKYRSLVEASTEGLLMYMDNKVSFVNAVFEKMTAMQLPELMQKDISQLIDIPDDIKNKLLSNNYDFKQISVESAVYRPDGKKVDVLLNIMPLEFYGKEAVIFSVKDVSSDKLIKEELFYNKDKFQSLMDNLNQGIFRTSLDLKGKFLEANKTALNIMGYTSVAELSNKYILDFFVELEDKKTFRKNLLEKGFVKNQIVKLRKKNGEIILAAVSLVVIYDAGKPKFCDGLIIDVTFQSTEDSLTEKINSDFASFSQMYYQPLKNHAENFSVCHFDSTLNSLLEKNAKNHSSLVMIKAQTGEFLGYINDKIIIERAFSSTQNFNGLKCYQIMSSPIPVVSEDIMVLEGLQIMKEKNIDFLVLEKEGEPLTNYVHKNKLFLMQEFMPVSLINNIEKAVTIQELKTIRNNFVYNLLPVIQSSTHSTIIFQNLSLLSDLLTKRIIKITLEEMGEPPVPFAFISMGSEGRQEQTLKTDQDNALIYDDIQAADSDSAADYFKRFSETVCTRLNDIGYNFCKGDVMAMNPKWCQPLSVWKNYFKKWIINGKAQDLLDICIFFDFRFVYGKEELAKDLKTYVLEYSKKNPAYLYHLALNTFNLKPQVGFWGNILLETAGAPPETVDIKKAIMPIVNFARIYALKNGLPQLNTTSRLRAFSENKILSPALINDTIQAFEYLAAQRLKRQASLMQKNTTPDNLINTKVLSELDKTIIKKVLSYINNMLSKLSYDFKGAV